MVTLGDTTGSICGSGSAISTLEVSQSNRVLLTIICVIVGTHGTALPESLKLSEMNVLTHANFPNG